MRWNSVQKKTGKKTDHRGFRVILAYFLLIMSIVIVHIAIAILANFLTRKLKQSGKEDKIWWQDVGYVRSEEKVDTTIRY